MVEFARSEFARADDWPVDVLNEPALFYVWRWFETLIDCREAGFGAGPLTYQEIDAWSRLSRVDVSAAEADILRRIDREYRDFIQKKDEPPKQSVAQVLGAARAAHDAAKRGG